MNDLTSLSRIRVILEYGLNYSRLVILRIKKIPTSIYILTLSSPYYYIFMGLMIVNLGLKQGNECLNALFFN